MVEWDLDEPFTQELLNHPTINLAVEPASSAGVFGIRTERDRKTIAGAGRVVGVKFRPGAFQPFFGRSVHQLTNRVVPLAAVFGAGGRRAGAGGARRGRRPVRGDGGVPARAAARARPAASTCSPRSCARCSRTPPSCASTSSRARHAMSPRTLQRLFRRYVGVSPKWVLQRYRLHEAAERIAEGRDGDWAATALELGYFDQAHFIRDFKALVGASPAQYAGAAA